MLPFKGDDARRIYTEASIGGKPAFRGISATVARNQDALVRWRRGL